MSEYELLSFFASELSKAKSPQGDPLTKEVLVKFFYFVLKDISEAENLDSFTPTYVVSEG